MKAQGVMIMKTMKFALLALGLWFFIISNVSITDNEAWNLGYYLMLIVLGALAQVPLLLLIKININRQKKQLPPLLGFKIREMWVKRF